MTGVRLGRPALLGGTRAVRAGDIADKVMGMLAGAMAELTVGDPGLLSTDIGPGDRRRGARKILGAHAERMEKEAR
jgi:RHH-type proline utilization regulon transcriptional repressor/proline dehydrogenase/delta 1-pyrroline-5-carboxylate dehydrogenase